MTPPMLANADVVLFLVTGAEKAEAVAAGVRGAGDRRDPGRQDPLARRTDARRPRSRGARLLSTEI
jgi:hypothetical protein